MAKNDVEIRLVVQDELTKNYKRIQNDIQRSNKKISGSQKQMAKDGQKAAKDLTKSFKGLGVSMKSVVGIAAGFIAFRKLNAVLRESVQLAGVQAEAIAKVEATIKATGSAAGVTSEELQKMAIGLQGVTLFGDEVILRGQSMLLTFKKIGKDVFPAATETMLNMATAMGTDVKEAAIQLGKALNDPSVGLTALQRVGITFSDSQKDVIKTMQKTGDIAGAQKVILKELESQFGGLARAVAKSGTGPLIQFQNIVGDVKEKIGSALIPVLIDLAEKARAFIESDAFTKIGHSLQFLVDNLDKAVIAGKIFLTVFAVSKLASITTAVRGFNVQLIKVNAPLAILTTGLLAIEGVLALMEKRTESLAGKDFITSEDDVKRTKEALETIQKLSSEVDSLRSKRSVQGGFGGLQVSGINAAEIARIKAFDEAVQTARDSFGSSFDPKRANLPQLIKGLGATEQKLKDVVKVQKEASKTIVEPTVPQTTRSTAVKTAVPGGRTVDFQKALQDAADAKDKLVELAGKTNSELELELLSGKEKELAILKNFETEKRNILLAGSTDDVALTKVVEQRKTAILEAHAQARKESMRAQGADFVSNLGVLAKANKKFGAIFKASAIAQTTIDTFAGAQAAFKALAGIPIVGPVLGSAAAAAAIGAGLVRVSNIKSQKFQSGGVVEGNNFSGDNVNVRANSGELILNRSQQRNLFALANGRGGGGGPNITFEAPVINVANGNPEVIRRAVKETMQEQINNFALTQNDAEIHGVLS